MNRKGFTLIEVLAVIVILGIILVVAAPNLLNAYEASKLKSEEIFVDRLSDVIDSYVKLNSNDIGFSEISGNFEKKYIGSNNQEIIERPKVYEGKIDDNGNTRNIKIQDIISDNLISKDDYINPGNKDVNCESDAKIEVYRDSDFVYCHKVKKDALGCLTDNYINSITGDYIVDTCMWKEVS